MSRNRGLLVGFENYLFLSVDRDVELDGAIGAAEFLREVQFPLCGWLQVAQSCKFNVPHRTDTNFSSPRWQTPSPAAWELARRREATLRPLAESPTVSPFDVQNAAHELCLGRTQIYELIARYRKRPHTSTLLRGKRGRRTRSRFLKPAIEEIVNDVVKKFFPTRERPRVSDLLQFINVACDEQGLPTPNYRTVRRRLRTLDPKLVASKRLGAKAAREIFAPVHASSAGLLLPLDVVQIDHTPADVIVVDEHDRQPIGRPWLTQ